MNLLLNIIWLILGDFIVAIAYLLGGILLYLTIIGIPFGIQCFKLAGLALMPLNKHHVSQPGNFRPAKCSSFLTSGRNRSFSSPRKPGSSWGRTIGLENSQ